MLVSRFTHNSGFLRPRASDFSDIFGFDPATRV